MIYTKLITSIIEIFKLSKVLGQTVELIGHFNKQILVIINQLHKIIINKVAIQIISKVKTITVIAIIL